MREITKIIIHCTATRPGQDDTVDIITRWHKQRGFRTIGYHYFIDYDGHIHESRPLSQAGAHVRGHNATSIGIAFAGGLDAHCKPADTRTPEQTHALLHLLRQLHQQFPNATIHGHYEFAAKACPCFNVQEWLKTVSL